jgi:protein TonB
MDALAGRLPRRRPWRVRLAILISLLIHVAIGLLLLVTIRHEGTPELLPPPSPVTMVFESGRKSGPTLPNPEPQPRPSTPPAPQAPPAETVPLPTPPTPPAIQPPPPAPPPPPVPAPVEPPAPSPPAPPVEVSPPTPPTKVAPPPPPPPPPSAEVAPPPPPPPAAKPSPAPKPPAARPPPVRSPPRQAAPPKSSDFPAPMNFSFGKPNLASPSPARPRSAPHIPGTIDMSLGPASRGAADPTPLSQHDAEAAGADWRNALSRWVSEHAYYPEQARRDGEEGDAKVHVLADSDGRVREVELIGKSGSMWLDLALQALFRDQHIPPLPSGDHDPIEFDFTMHYVLIRPR